jgi:hypothetical protein
MQRNINRDHKEIEYAAVDWIQQAFDKVQRLAVVNIIIKVPVLYRA